MFIVRLKLEDTWAFRVEEAVDGTTHYHKLTTYTAH